MGQPGKADDPYFGTQRKRPAWIAGAWLRPARYRRCDLIAFAPRPLRLQCLFQKATVICHACELEAAQQPQAEKAGYLASEWNHGRGFETIATQRDLFGDNKVILIPLPGHTPGTMGALVALDRSGSFLLASDTVSLRETLDREIVPRNT